MTTTSTRLLDNYVAGRWTPATAATGELDVTNPATGEVLARVPLSGAADLDAAVTRRARGAARVARGLDDRPRAQAVRAARATGRAHEDLARSVTTEMGKTIVDARAEVARMIEMVEAACAIPTTMQGRILEDVSRNIDAETIRQPVGVCAAIVPFNFPAMVPFWFLPFAIACGNTFVLKPSEQVPLTQQIAFEEFDALGLPAGVVNLVNGGREVVEGILDHPGIDAVSFVGSAPVARIVYERAAQAGKRVQALGGAKNHMVVMPDAVIDRPSTGSSARRSGRPDSAAWRARSWYRRRRPRAADAAADRGDPRAERRRRARRALRRRPGDLVRRPRPDQRVDRARRRRRGQARGRRPRSAARPDTDGASRRSDDPRRCRARVEIAREEVFGPVLCVIRAESLDQAIEIVNSSPFGNGTSIFTESGASVRRYRHEVQAGMIGVNIGVAAPVAFFPFSGWKDSFLGDLHAHGPDAVEFYTRKKTVTSRWFSSGQGSGSYFVER